jgi:hypothetical protein
VLRIEFRHALDGLGVAARVEVDYFGIGVLEREDDGICGEGGEGGVEFLWWLVRFCMTKRRMLGKLEGGFTNIKEM